MLPVRTKHWQHVCRGDANIVNGKNEKWVNAESAAISLIMIMRSALLLTMMMMVMMVAVMMVAAMSDGGDDDHDGGSRAYKL